MDPKPISNNDNSVPHVFKAAGTACIGHLLDEGSHARADLAILVDARDLRGFGLTVLAGLAAVALAYLVYQRAKLEDPDRGTTDVLSAFGLGRSADGRRKIWPSITGYIFIPMYPPARTGSN